MDGGDAAWMAGAPSLEQIQGLAAANLADYDAVGRRRKVGRTSSAMETTPGRVRNET